jgi:hypothetical protein
MITFPLSATFDRESRGEFYRYCGETFQMYVAAGVPPKDARRYAIQDTAELAAKYIERQS